jgi:hypothetical protein
MSHSTSEPSTTAPPTIPEIKAENTNLTPLSTPQLSHTELSTPQIPTMQTPNAQQQMDPNQHQHYQHDHRSFDMQPTHHFHALGVDTGQQYSGEITGQQYSDEPQHYTDESQHYPGDNNQYAGLSLDPNDLKTMNPLDSFASMI